MTSILQHELDRMRPAQAYHRVLHLRAQCAKRFYQQHHAAFVDTPCPACGSAGTDSFRKFGFQHRRCDSCATLWCSPRPTEALLSEYYEHWEAPRSWTEFLLATDSSRTALQHVPRIDRILEALKDRFSERAALAVDVGAGSGAFARALKNTGYFDRVLAIDIARDCVDACTQRGLEASQASVRDLATDSVDLLTVNDLIEHVFDPKAFLESCHQALKRRGVISIATPNSQGFDFKVLKDFAVSILPPEHLNYFNRGSIRLLLESAGFRDVTVATPGLLDAQIVIRESLAKRQRLEQQNEYLSFLLFENGHDVVRRFQSFLSENGLSSHMLALAWKKP